MIKKLRAKFVLIIMSLVTVILAAVLVGICLFFAQGARRQSRQTLEIALSRPSGHQPPNFQIGGSPPENFNRNPVFVLALGQVGRPELLLSDRVELSEEDLAAIGQALAQTDAAEGELAEYSLRYLVRDTPNGRVAALIDITEEKRLIGSMVLICCLVGLGALAAFFAVSVFLARWALRPVEKAWAQQRRFVSDASHELKTPLTVILANTEILRSHPEDSVGAQMNWVENTGQEAARMKALVDNLLFLAKSDDAAEPVAMAPVCLSEVATGCVLLFESIAFEQGVTLAERVEPGIHVLGNEAQLKQLVGILLDNAIKYAPQRSTVTLMLQNHYGTARLCVHNGGAPISEREKAHLFERFYRADPSRAKDGYGLGLSIAQTIAEAHKGKITVDSSTEVGTTFTVSLPVRT